MRPMQYYSVFRTDDAAYGEVSSPVGVNGIVLESGNGEITACKATAELVGDNTQFGDHMHCRSNLMVSRKAEASIRKLRLVPGTRLVHTTVLDRGKEIAQVTAIIFSRLLRVIDKEKSESGTFGSYVPLRVSEPIIKYKAVRRFDLMQAYDIHWVCSEALKSEVDSAGLTNFTFVPLKMSGK